MKAMSLSESLLTISEIGEAVSQTDKVRLLFSVIRDCAFKFRKELAKEIGIDELFSI